MNITPTKNPRRDTARLRTQLISCGHPYPATTNQRILPAPITTATLRRLPRLIAEHS